MAVNEALLEKRLSALETARWGPRVVSRLEALIRSGEDDALFRVNPIKIKVSLSPRRSIYSFAPQRKGFSR